MLDNFLTLATFRSKLPIINGMTAPVSHMPASALSRRRFLVGGVAMLTSAWRNPFLRTGIETPLVQAASKFTSDAVFGIKNGPLTVRTGDLR